jgi:hypothetical protein
MGRCTCGHPRERHPRTHYYIRRRRHCRDCRCDRYRSQLIWDMIDLGMNIVCGCLAAMLAFGVVLALIILAQNPYQW